MRSRSKNSTESTTSPPANAPIMIALSGEIVAQGAVTATSPDNAPLSAMLISGLPALTQVVSVAATTPAQAARLVLSAISPMALPAPAVGSPPPVTPVVLPAL